MLAKQIVLNSPNKQKRLSVSNKYNHLQKAVIELFLPRYAKGSSIAYLKHSPTYKTICDTKALSQIGVETGDSKNWPGIILLNKKKNWLFLIQIITSKKQTLPRQVTKLKILFSGCSFSLIFINAFEGYDDMNKYLVEPAWGTATWMAEVPNHLIHFNGGRLIKPRYPRK